MDHQPSHPSKIRRRANKACLACRARKVRCDVSQRGRPCMNCFLDSEACVVIGRASRRRTLKDVNNADKTDGDADQSDLPGEGHSSEGRISTPAQPSNVDVVTDMMSDEGSEKSETGMNSIPDFGAASTLDGGRETGLRAPEGDPYRESTRYAPRHEPLPQQPHSSIRTRPEQLQWIGEQSMRFGSDITHSYYPFLEANNLSKILPQDVSYLEMQGCLRVPTKPILDDFVKQYFLHVHPIMPLLNEGDFWEMYGSQPDGTSTFQKLSLLVLQAMLFSACSYVPLKSLEALGYADAKAARAACYRRAKLLFDFEAESSPIAIAQAALLLSFWSACTTHHQIRTNSYWLSVAIQQAKAAGAHRCYGPDLDDPHHATVLTRLWLCLILQDRVLSLCFRKPIQLTKVHYDTDNKLIAPIEPAILWHEVRRTRVYNLDTKESLNAMFALLTKLSVVLTDLLTEVCPLDEQPPWEMKNGGESTQSIQNYKMRMRHWYQAATLTHPEPRDSRMSNTGVPGFDSLQPDFQHESVTLYSGFMYLLYHSAMTKLCHHECLHLIHTSLSNDDGDLSSSDRIELTRNRLEIAQAAWAVIRCLNVLMQHRLSRWLPPNSMACISLPLILCILDVKMSPRPNSEHRRLHDLSEVMKKYQLQPQPDITDQISETIQAILGLARLEDFTQAAPTSLTGERVETHNDYMNMTPEAGLHPSICLRVALTSDASSRSDEKDSPAALRRVLASSSLNRTKAVLSDGMTAGLKSSAKSPEVRRASMSTARDEIMRRTIARWTQEDQAISFGVQLGIVSADLAREDEAVESSEPIQTVGENGLNDRVSTEVDLHKILGQALSEEADTLERSLLDACVLIDQLPRADSKALPF